MWFDENCQMTLEFKLVLRVVRVTKVVRVARLTRVVRVARAVRVMLSTACIVTLSLCEFACEATTVRQAFNSNTPANKGEIACQIKS